MTATQWHPGPSVAQYSPTLRVWIAFDFEICLNDIAGFADLIGFFQINRFPDLM